MKEKKNHMETGHAVGHCWRTMAVIACLLLTASALTAQSRDRHLEGYRLVFSDEFNSPNGSQPDPQVWSRCQRHISDWNYCFKDHPRTAEVRNGALLLRAFRCEDEQDTVTMWSGGVESKNKMSFQYGRVEVRLKTRRHDGNFPAVWMLPQPPCAEYPHGGEIDIFETIDRQMTSYHTTHSHFTLNVVSENERRNHFRRDFVNVGRWHVYAVEWTPEALAYFVDGQLVDTYRKSTDSWALANGQWPFDHPFYLILNQAVGRQNSWARPADSSYTYETRIDWIRVYQKE